ncbi:hypothetical protein PUR_28670 [Paenibacillus sp. URB8-2]|nr:hypothetical protein PUR_28670 [Paenibacillus sp. URB8-2]
MNLVRAFLEYIRDPSYNNAFMLRAGKPTLDLSEVFSGELNQADKPAMNLKD